MVESSAHRYDRTLVLDRVTKRFGKIVAVDQVSIVVQEREFLGLVGPTGCGKTTLLRLIAGLERQDEGHIYIHGECVDRKRPRDRAVRMVFQDDALWPHMQVFDPRMYSNLSFAMKLRGRSPDRIAQLVDAIAGRLGIERKLYPRRPKQLSAGQRQMVGIGRAMTIKPKVLLLDEPLSNVDPQRRLLLRRELKSFHESLGTITIYVTHNLREAFSLADRIAIMNEGQIIQVDTPARIKGRPANSFVKDFIQCFEL